MRRPIGQRERAAIFERAGGRCHLCGEKIDGVRERWDVEHVVPRELGGTEASMDRNLQPAHAGKGSCHAVKTKDDQKRIAKAKRIANRHIGATRSARPLPGGRGDKWKQKVGGGWVRREDEQ